MEIKHKFHLKNQTEIGGLAVVINNNTKAYNLDEEIEMIRLVRGKKVNAEFKRLTYINNESDFQVKLSFTNGLVKVVYNEEDNNYLVLLEGEEAFYGKVYDYFLNRILPDKTYTEINDKVYSILPHEDGFLVTDMLEEETVGYLTPRKLHLIILESKLEKQESHYLLHITKEWIKDLVPRKEEE